MSVDLTLEWKVPLNLFKGMSEPAQRRRRQTESAAPNITGYEVLVSTVEDSMSRDYANAPTGQGMFNRTFEVWLCVIELILS